MVGKQGARKRKPVRAASADLSDQMELFTQPAAQAARKPSGLRRLEPLTPQVQLRQLIGTLVRTTGLPHAEVNRRLNTRLGLTSRSGAGEEVIVRAVSLAEAWLASPSAAASVTAGGMARPCRRKQTFEQDLAVEAKRRGEHIALQAGAGTGKTTTLDLLARSDFRRGLYLAFNRTIADEAAGRFPRNVSCRTGHSLARAGVGHRFADRLDAPRRPGWKVGEELGIAVNMVIWLGKRKITNRGLSYIAFRTVQRFCHSADEQILPHHVPWTRGVEDAGLHAELVNLVLPYARKAWQELQDPKGGIVRFEHDHYLKMWALTQPRIKADFIMLDEAQDTNPVLEQVFRGQRDHAQLIMVGDSAQAIYGWRGARDVMTGFDGRQLTLSQSFRFGPALAHEANRWLAMVEAPLRLRGTDTIDTRIGPLEHSDAILCRTNGGVMQEVLRLLESGRRVGVAGGAGALQKLTEAAAQLKAGHPVSHPELMLFQSWRELQEYAQCDPAGQDLTALVEVIDEYGVEVIQGALKKLHDETSAEVTVSTAHKAKGREWDSVRIAYDFEPDNSQEIDADGIPVPKPVNQDDARLAYVAVTRARRHLDLGGLTWINSHPQGGSVPAARPAPCGSQPHPEPQPALGPSPWDRLGPQPRA